jgi:hypothetical protein
MDIKQMKLSPRNDNAQKIQVSDHDGSIGHAYQEYGLNLKGNDDVQIKELYKHVLDNVIKQVKF